MTLVEKPILNPSLPYIGPIQTGISPGKYIRILGAALPYGKVIKCNLQCGSSGYDDIALQLQINFGQNLITLNSHQYNSRDEEQSYGNLYITKGEQFEILIICEPTVFKAKTKMESLPDGPKTETLNEHTQSEEIDVSKEPIRNSTPSSYRPIFWSQGKFRGPITTKTAVLIGGFFTGIMSLFLVIFVCMFLH